MSTPYTHRSNILCIPFPSGCSTPSCPTEPPTINITGGAHGVINLSVDNYQEWIGATITVLILNTVTFIIDIPGTVSEDTVPSSLNPFQLDITLPNPIVNSSLFTGIVHFTLPNSCRACAGYTDSVL
jgi:hypothetical protein